MSSKRKVRSEDAECPATGDTSCALQDMTLERRSSVAPESKRRLTVVWHGATAAEYRRPFQLLHEGVWDVTLIAPRRWRLYVPTEVTYERAEGESFRAIPLEPRFDWHGALFTFRKLRAALQEARPELLFVYEEPYSLLAYLLMRWCRERRVPLVVQTCQDIHKRHPPPFRAMERAVLREAVAMLGLNRTCLDVLRRKGYMRPLDVAGSGIDPERYSVPRGDPERNVQRAFRIGYVGRLAEEKGVDLILRALERLPTHCTLTVAGDGPEAGSLRELAQRLSLQDRVRWLGAVAHAELPAVYAKFDAMILASRTRSNWQEQFGRVLIEAMAAGVPVVATRCGAIPEVLGDAGLLVDEDDADGLASVLRALSEDAPRREALAERGRARVHERYTGSAIAAVYDRVFREALAGGSEWAG